MSQSDRMPDEPVIVFTVRQLLNDLREDFNRRFDEVVRKLDDRVTIGAFRALSSELEATKRDLGDAHDEIAELQTWRTQLDTTAANDKRISDRRLAWAALIVAALTALATLIWLWIGG